MNVFIHGISSWIGYYLVEYFQVHYPSVKIMGTYHSNMPGYLKNKCDLFFCESNIKCPRILKAVKADSFINLSRGETNEDLKAHELLIAVCNQQRIHYLYASSFNACDANVESEHIENELPFAVSEYGRFKAACETALAGASGKYTVFRYAAVHGWAPNRIARTEDLLKKLAGNETFIFPRGIVQNRLHATVLAGMIGDVTMLQAEGIFHLGTKDSSDEIDFCRKIAQDFGYSPDCIREDGFEYVNAVMIPGKIYQYFGKKWAVSEEYTLRLIKKTPELRKYYKTHR